MMNTQYNVMKTDTHYCVDHATEQTLQMQRKVAYQFASPFVVYSGWKIGGSFGIALSLIGIAFGVINYKQYKIIKDFE